MNNDTGPGGGVISVVQATADSVNCAFVRLAHEVGLSNVISMANQLGVTDVTQKQQYPSMVIGAITVHPIEMAGAYATVADQGVYHKPSFIFQITDRAGDVIYNGAHMYLGEGVAAGGFGPWRAAIGKVEALGPRHIVAGHQNRRLDDDAGRTIAETRQYLDDADELLRSETTALGFFNAKIERYPDYLARTVLWAGASALYGVREHPGQDAEHVAQVLVAGETLPDVSPGDDVSFVIAEEGKAYLIPTR